MTTTDPPSREEVNAKLEAAEARLETKLVTMDAKLDNIANRVEAGIELSKEAKKAASSMKWNILFTAIGVIGVMVAIYALSTQAMEFVTTLLRGNGGG